jgi:hypothetical protein
MDNNMSRGWAMDLINSIANDLALANHLTETLHAKEVDLAMASEDDKERLEKNISDIRGLISNAVSLRRQKMNRLADAFEGYDPRMWCAVKHSIEGYMEAMEVFHATNSPEDWAILKTSMSQMSSVLSVALGFDLQPCARCFADELRDKMVE